MQVKAEALEETTKQVEAIKEQMRAQAETEKEELLASAAVEAESLKSLAAEDAREKAEEKVQDNSDELKELQEVLMVPNLPASSHVNAHRSSMPQWNSSPCS